jgi:hypothetical protein
MRLPQDIERELKSVEAAFDSLPGMKAGPSRLRGLRSAIESALKIRSAENERETIEDILAHWHVQGGKAEFGPLEDCQNADELVSDILRVVRASRQPSAIRRDGDIG